MSKLTDLATEIFNMDNDIKNKSNELDELKKAREEKQQELVAEMQDQDIAEFSVDTIGKRFTMKEDLYANCLVENKPVLFDALRNNGYGDLIKTDVNARSFNTLIKELTENGTQDLPDDFKDIVSVFKKSKISITKRG